jgi:hypothetical protein
VLVGFLLVAAVLIAGSGVGSAGWAKLSALTGLSSGLKTPMDPVVKVGVDDAADPVPYWLLSTRNPSSFAEAMEKARQRTPGR